MNAVELTQKLVQFDTINPGSEEGDCIGFLESFLADAGFETMLAEWKPGRPNLIARSRGGGGGPALCFAGHVDTVPLGTVPWTHDPFGGEIIDGKLFGRGATDMKSGVAAMVVAAMEAAKLTDRSSDVLLAITAGEETGCEGSLHMSRTPELFGNVGAMIVTEPTDSELKLGHRGALWLKARRRGVAAHGSRPDLGDNAVYGLAEGVLSLRDLAFPVDADPILGIPSLNVGTFQGGSKINMVPDLAETEIDIRTLPGQKSSEITALVQKHLGKQVEIEVLMDLSGIIAEIDDPWVCSTAEAMETSIETPGPNLGLAYFTDAAALIPAMGNVPTLFLGPGDLTMLHKVDEFVSVSAIESCTEKLALIARDWCK